MPRVRPGPQFVSTTPNRRVAVQKGDALSVYGLQITLIVVFDPPSPVGQQFPYLLFQSVVLPGEPGCDSVSGIWIV